MYVFVCVFLGFITLSLHKGTCLCACSFMSMHFVLMQYFVFLKEYACVIVLFSPVADRISSFCYPFITDTALHAAKTSYCVMHHEGKCVFAHENNLSWDKARRMMRSPSIPLISSTNDKTNIASCTYVYISECSISGQFHLIKYWTKPAGHKHTLFRQNVREEMLTAIHQHTRTGLPG